MRVANTVELKNKTNELLREVMKGNPLIITYRGRPAASILPLSEKDLNPLFTGFVQEMIEFCTEFKGKLSPLCG